MEDAAKTLIGNIGQLLAAEYRQLSGVGAEIGELRDDLETMNALLRMQSEAEDGAVDHFLRVWMKQLRELAYDAEDRIDLYLLRVKCRSDDGVRARLRHLLATIFSRRSLAGDIRALRARAAVISERHARYGVNREVLRRSPSMLTMCAPAQALDPEHALNQVIVGIDSQVETLAKVLLANHADGHCHLNVLSIVGFGGLGKTTLAMELCRRLEADFPYQAFVSVSQAFDPTRDLKALLKRMLQQIVKPRTKDEKGIKVEGFLGDIDRLDAPDLAELLERCLKGKSPTNVSGHHVHDMEPLKFQDSKKLFLSRAYGPMVVSCPEELEHVMGNILNKCGGLPLAIVSIARVFAAYKLNKDMWETICKSIGSQMESNPTLEGVREIVTVSYNYLPYELKGCMMYFSIFPEDYEIKKDRLLRRWIAEGLVPEKRGLTSMEVAESYLDELVSRNMVEPCFGYDGKVESCQVHDMFLEVMVSKSLESNFVSLMGGQYAEMSYDRIRRLSIQGDCEQRPYSGEQPKKKMMGRGSQGIKGTDVEHVRSLSMVLDLEDCEGLTNHHMRNVCRLSLLKFLSVKGTNIDEMPSQLGKLVHLQTLNTRGTYLTGLPETVINLEKLERIEFRHKIEWDLLWCLPTGLQKMKALREVDVAFLNKDNVQAARELGELQQLQGIAMYIQHQVQDDVIKELALSLSKLYSLRKLDISHADLNNGEINFLHDIPTPPRLLRYLRIEGPVLKGGLPNWVGSLTYLVEFHIMRAGLVDDQLFDVLCKLPNLKSIWMQKRCYNDNEIVARTSHNFPALVSLKVTCDETSLPKIFRFEKGSMDKLETLEMYFTEVERSIVGIEHLTNLKEVKLRGLGNSPSVNRALQQLKDENMKRPPSSQIRVVVKYEGPSYDFLSSAN
ncbi:hypothetical protein EJB05_49690, partial [Eragrostis curvula]